MDGHANDTQLLTQSTQQPIQCYIAHFINIEQHNFFRFMQCMAYTSNNFILAIFRYLLYFLLAACCFEWQNQTLLLVNKRNDIDREVFAEWTNRYLTVTNVGNVKFGIICLIINNNNKNKYRRMSIDFLQTMKVVN